MNTLQIAVIDTGLQVTGYDNWCKEKSNEHMQIIGWGITTQEAAELLKQKPDCVLYNPWGLFMADPAQALVCHQWGAYAGLCYGVEYLGAIYRLSPKTKVLICTDDIDREFVLEQGQRFKNFSGYLHYSDNNIMEAVVRVMQGEIVAGDVPDHYYPTLKNIEPFEAICQQTDLLALATHQRRSPQHMYYSLLFSMEVLKVRSFAEYKAYLLPNRNAHATTS